MNVFVKIIGFQEDLNANFCVEFQIGQPNGILKSAVKASLKADLDIYNGW